MNTKIFEMLMRRTGLRRDSKAEIIQLEVVHKPVKLKKIPIYHNLSHS